MKKQLILAAAVLFALVSCKNSAPLLPTISGKAGEVLVVIEKSEWDSELGETVRNTLADEYPYLPMKEPRYTLINVPHGGFGNLFNIHRNIVYFDINPQAVKTGVKLMKDKWATPQCLILVSAHTTAMADSLFKANSALIISAIEQAERDRVITNTMLYENREVFKKVSEVFGGSVHVPNGYKLRKMSDNFAWISDDKQYTTQGIFIYRYPVEGNDFESSKIIGKRNSFLKENVPGMLDNTYMITSTFWTPETQFLKYKGRNFAETHGLWEVEGDFMGGPFVSHSFYSKDGKYIIVAEAWVYAPKYDKRQYLRQTESLLYSWENK